MKNEINTESLSATAYRAAIKAGLTDVLGSELARLAWQSKVADACRRYNAGGVYTLASANRATVSMIENLGFLQAGVSASGSHYGSGDHNRGK